MIVAILVRELRWASYLAALSVMLSLSGCRSQPTTHMTDLAWGPASKRTQITAADITFNKAQGVAYARGNVQIVSQTTTITADEADVHGVDFNPEARLEVDLRGKVRVVIAPADSRAK